jgi:hypothetical protein
MAVMLPDLDVWMQMQTQVPRASMTTMDCSFSLKICMGKLFVQ